MSDSSNVFTMPPPRPPRKAPDAAFWVILNRLLVVVVFFVLGICLYAWQRPLDLLFTLMQARLRLGGIASRYVQVDGYRIHYYAGGSGEPIVLVHGLGSRAEDWTNLMLQFVDGKHRVYALDLLGYGRSSHPRDAAYSISQEAGIVEKFIASQNLTQTDLAGSSMGGWIALRVALDQPSLIRRLAIYDSAGIRYSVPFETSIFWPDTPARLAELGDLLSPNRAQPLPAFIERDVLRLIQRNGWVIQRSMQSMLTGVDVVDGKLGSLKMPMLIAWGKLDKITPIANAYAMHAQVPQSVLEIYDGCGHLAPRECSSQIGPNTLAFLDANPPLPAQVKEIPHPAGK